MNWMILPLKRYADFSGRSRRLEYWMFTLMIILMIGLTVAALAMSAGRNGEPNDGFTVASIIAIAVFLLGIMIPSLAVQVRRMHDQNMSGWWILLGLIPYIGGIIMLVFMCIPGTNGTNRFGADPKERNGY